HDLPSCTVTATPHPVGKLRRTLNNRTLPRSLDGTASMVNVVYHHARHIVQQHLPDRAYGLLRSS
ncbi:MAG TPA: hypothetical protein VEZ44_00045, partial [bacterium]|nr:hypothetical protein [bacterium]